MDGQYHCTKCGVSQRPLVERLCTECFAKEVSQLSMGILIRIQWSGRNYGHNNESVDSCPICRGIPKGLFLSLGQGRLDKGRGHAPDCVLGDLIKIYCEKR